VNSARLTNDHEETNPICEGSAQVESRDNLLEVQAPEISTAQAIQTFTLVEAKSKAETAELQKRLVMQQFRPCKLYPTIIYHDGLRWVCSYGAIHGTLSDYLPDDIENIGVTAYGMCPEEAMQNFDGLWVGTEEESDEDVQGN